MFQKVKQCFLHHVCHLRTGNVRETLRPTVQSNTRFADYFSEVLCLKRFDVPRSPSVTVQPEPRAAWKAQRRMEECVPS